MKDDCDQVKVKLVGGPAHGKKMFLPRLSLTVMVPEIPKIDIWRVPGIPIDTGYHVTIHEYRLTNVEYKGIRYYTHSKLNAVKSKTLQKAYMDAQYEKWKHESGMVAK